MRLNSDLIDDQFNERLREIKLIKKSGQFLIDNCDRISALIQAVEYTDEKCEPLFFEHYHGGVVSRLGLSNVIKIKVENDLFNINDIDENSMYEIN